MISEKAILYPNVKLGPGCKIEDYAIIGSPPDGFASGELATVIGANAVIRSHTVIYAGNRIGENFRTGNKANIRELNEIGDNVNVGTLSVIEHRVKIGNGVRIHTQVFVPEFTILDDECWIGPNVVITNAKYPFSPDAKKDLQGAHVKKNAIIGANSTLLPGVVIGKCALVGAGSVVTKNVPDCQVVGGNPARFIKSILTIKSYGHLMELAQAGSDGGLL
ncbi:MAG TPA: transferase [Deltaproteobacteria bacterium]|nr:MAG: transferase [Deltaproteobacteria bacterium GWA2_55_82]OGQ63525.1 MAG: transferase [Deltaproteobacteria bacterium RIFCSPLOWO2_02_FULL_55_12]OIJ74907.1 MAG: transferase [Deltaproteobacteria bacterium GWC2_55_46]HBG47439.1 transferase [Deltaproteobacteria bacterium]HCY11455.1 transferase [Deltaproteobacteria bacterium]